MEQNNKIAKRGERRFGLYDPFFDTFFDLPLYDEKEHHNVMKTDIKELDNAYELTVDVPGLAKDQIGVELNDGYLTISANENSNNDVKDKKGRFIRHERYTGSYERSFYVGDIKQDDIKAKLDNGVLTVTFPKESEKQEAKKLIAIE